MANLTLAPPPYHTVLDTAGAPVPLACIWTYVAGTTTPLATYSDALGTPNLNPIRADSAGRFTAYLIAGAAYRFVYETPATPPAHGAVLRTADNIQVPFGAVTTEGLWTPTITGTGGGSGQTYVTQEGRYIKIDRLVWLSGTVQLSARGTITGFVQIGGLPFVMESGVVEITIGQVAWVGTQTGFVNLVGQIVQGTAAIIVGGISVATQGNTSGLVQADLTDNTALLVSISYRTAS